MNSSSRRTGFNLTAMLFTFSTQHLNRSRMHLLILKFVTLDFGSKVQHANMPGREANARIHDGPEI